MINDILYYSVSSFLFLAIIRESMGIFFIKKDVPCFFSFVVWGLFFVSEIVGTTYIDTPIGVLCFDICCELVFCMLLYDGTIRKKILWVLFINLLGMISETAVGYVFLIMSIEIEQRQILGSFISKIVMLVILLIIKVYNHVRLKRDIPLSYWCVLFIIPVGSIFVLHTIFSLSELSHNKSMSLSALISSAFIMVINSMFFYLYEKLSDRLEIRKQQIIFNKQLELCKKQIFESEETALNLRNLKHDIQNHLICVREYIERDDYEYAKRYIDNLIHAENSFNMLNAINSGNLVIDTLLNYKNQIMQDLGILLHTHIEIPYNLYINDADICIILGNCLDNSIEAVSKMAADVEKIINVEIIYRREILILKITNPYTGSIKRDNQGNLITTKDNAENHGIGLESVKKVAKKYDGLVKIETENQTFEIRVFLYSQRKNYI